MTTYRYKGQTPEGSKVSGVIRAYDEYDAVSKLRDTCAFVIKLEEVREKKDSVLTRPLRTKIKEKDLALICSQFSIILGTGLPVMRCVEMVAGQNRNKHLARRLHKVAEDIGAGYSMAQSFETNIPGLPKTFVETVRAGEQSGALEACFKRLYKYYDKSAKTRAKIVSTMTYPVMVIVTAIIVFAIIMVVAVPAFTSAFAELGTDLPAVTRGLMSTSAFLTRWWWLILFILALLTIGYLSFKRTERGKLAIANYALRRAPLRRLHTLHLSGQFASTMSTMLAAGLPVQAVLGIVSQISDNYVFSLGVRKVKEGVDLANIRSGYANAQIIAMTEGSEANGDYGLNKDGTVTTKGGTGTYTTQSDSKYVADGTSIAGQFTVGTGGVTWESGKTIVYTVENGKVKTITPGT